MTQGLLRASSAGSWIAGLSKSVKTMERIPVAEARKYEDLVVAGTAAHGIPADEHLEYGAFGLAGEAGEVANKVKKLLWHGKTLDAAAAQDLQEELGDTLWYLALAARTLGTSIRGLALQNIVKLNARHPDKYPDPLNDIVVEL